MHKWAAIPFLAAVAVSFWPQSVGALEFCAVCPATITLLGLPVSLSSSLQVAGTSTVQCTYGLGPLGLFPCSYENDTGKLASGVPGCPETTLINLQLLGPCS